MTGVGRVVIVGAGHAGGRAAQALRQAGFAGAIALVGEERHPPYERPPLSKALIVTDAGIEKVQLHPPAYYAEHGIDLVLGTPAKAIDRRARTLALADGRALPYDRLMLTTGARVRRLALPGADLAGVLYLRDLDESQAIRGRLGPGVRVVVVGGGFIGLETAASARARGAAVTVLEAAERLMGRAVAPELGAWFAELHRAKGVDVRLAQRLVAFEGAGKVERVATEAGAVAADLVVVGIGIVPNVEIAAAAGLAVENGIVVDEFGRTSDPLIYAAGDCALQPNKFLGRRVRFESYQNAQDQAMAVARNMIAETPTPYEDSLWVWSDQHDVNLQMAGFPEGYDRLVWRGDPAGGAFMLFHLKAGRIVAVAAVNQGREMRPAMRLMQSGKAFDPAALADPAQRLLKLAKD